MNSSVITNVRAVLAAAASIVVLAAGMPRLADSQEILELRRANVASDGTQAAHYVPQDRIDFGVLSPPGISSNGEFVAFDSQSTNLVPNDTNSSIDIFLHVMSTGETVRVSVASDGQESELARISGSSHIAVSDGGDVLFTSAASNLVPNDTNGYSDVFLHSFQNGSTERVSVRSDGSEISDPNVERPEANTTIRGEDITPDGRYVLFVSQAAGIVPGDEVARESVFIRDVIAGETALISKDMNEKIPTNGESVNPQITPDGRYVTFQTTLYQTSIQAPSYAAADLDNTDVYVVDRATGELFLESLAYDGTFKEPGLDSITMYPSISDDGRYLVFSTDATNIVENDTNGLHDVFLRDRELGKTVLIARGGMRARISGDGRVIAYQTAYSTCFPSQILAYDISTDVLTRVSVGPDGKFGNSDSEEGSISGDGSLVVFRSWSDNLVVNDDNEIEDVFVATLGSGSASRGSFVTPFASQPGTMNECDGDDDGDEMSNYWEIFYGLDPLDAADAMVDSDGDGTSNLEEFRSGTRPTPKQTWSSGGSGGGGFGGSGGNGNGGGSGGGAASVVLLALLAVLSAWQMWRRRRPAD